MRGVLKATGYGFGDSNVVLLLCFENCFAVAHSNDVVGKGWRALVTGRTCGGCGQATTPLLPNTTDSA